MIRTVLGDISESGLGVTYAHDHLVVRETKYNRLSSRLLIDDIEKTVNEVNLFKRVGGNSIVDVQPFGAGRDAEALKEISKRTGINIIAATGLHKKEFYADGFWSWDANCNEIAELLISEIEEGMFSYDYVNPFNNRTDIKAGIIKIATDEDGLNEYYKKVFRAATIAQKNTGVPIITHTELSMYGVEQVEFLLENGVKPEKIIISHMDKKINIKNITCLAKTGVFLEFDSIARYKYHTDEREVELIIDMIQNGFENQILLGMDSTKERLLAYGGKYGLGYIIDKFVPLMEKMGIGIEIIKKMLTYNPANALRFN